TEELQRLYADNVTANEARAQFFATISHEFRMPLFAILASSEMLTDPDLRPSNEAELAEYVGTIDQSARLLLERVNELLDLAKTDTGALELDTEAVALPAIWRELAPSVAALARIGGLEVEADVGDDLPAVNADPTRLRQV